MSFASVLSQIERQHAFVVHWTSEDFRMTGMMWSAGCRFLLSASAKKLFELTVPSLENSSATWISPDFSWKVPWTLCTVVLSVQ